MELNSLHKEHRSPTQLISFVNRITILSFMSVAKFLLETATLPYLLKENVGCLSLLKLLRYLLFDQSFVTIPSADCT